MKLKHTLFSVKQYFNTSSKMLWEMTRCHHIKKVITWGQPVKTKIPGRFVSISTKVWQKADRFMPQIPAFFSCLALQQLSWWAVEKPRHPDSQLFSSPFEREPRAWQLASQTFRLLGNLPGVLTESLGDPGSFWFQVHKFWAVWGISAVPTSQSSQATIHPTNMPWIGMPRRPAQGHPACPPRQNPSSSSFTKDSERFGFSSALGRKGFGFSEVIKSFQNQHFLFLYSLL